MNIHEEIEKTNLKWLSCQDEYELSRSILLAFSNKEYIDFQELELSDKYPALSQIQNLFEKLAPKKQELFKYATVRAINEWQPRAHGGITLQRLAYLCTYIRASQCIEQFRVILLEQKLYSLHKGKNKTITILLSSIASFAPLSQVSNLFEVLIKKLEFSGNASLLFLGLCTCKPEKYPEYFKNFIQLSKIDEFNPDEYSFAMSEFVRIVTTETIVKYFFELESEYWDKILKILCLGERPALEIYFKNSAIWICSTNIKNNMPSILISEDNISIGIFPKIFNIYSEIKIYRNGLHTSLAASTSAFIDKIDKFEDLSFVASRI